MVIVSEMPHEMLPWPGGLVIAKALQIFLVVARTLIALAVALLLLLLQACSWWLWKEEHTSMASTVCWSGCSK